MADRARRAGGDPPIEPTRGAAGPGADGDAGFAVREPPAPAPPTPPTPPATLHGAGARLHALPAFEDARGTLSFGQVGDHIPFEPKRYFVIGGVPAGVVRGGHAHREQHQFMVALRGACRIVLDDGGRRTEVVLDRQTLGLHVPPLVWGTLHDFTADALLLVLTSGAYDAAEYVGDYAAFAAATAHRR